MTLRAAAEKLISTRKASRPTTAYGISWAAFLTLVIAGPWVSPGYLFGTDWPGPRHFSFPMELSSSAPTRSVLAAISMVLDGEATGKLIVFAIIFSAALLAFLAAPSEHLVAKAAASAVYVVNPFVYGRLHYGQLFLLAAFAFLPWAALRVRAVVDQPGRLNAFLVAVSFVVLGALSLHIFLMACLLFAITVSVRVVSARQRLHYLRRAAPWLAASAALTAICSLYWLIPLLASKGYEGRLVATVGPGELAAYAAVPDSTLGLIPNLMGLYGFWAENSGRFTSMKSFAPYWPAVLACLLAVCLVGAAAVLRRRSDCRTAWATTLLLVGGIAVMLEMGYSQHLTSGLVEWIDSMFVPYRGMRDAGKWAAMLALIYSQLFGIGTETLLSWLRSRPLRWTKFEWVGSLAAGLLLALPLYYGNGLLFGMHGEIKPSQYPSGWYAADRQLASDSHPGRTLILPWHEYMRLSFVQNQNSIVFSPAPTFFSTPVLVSTNPEVTGIPPPGDPEQVAIASLVSAGVEGQWANVLAQLNVKYVLVAHELDWSAFAYLDQQPDLIQVGEYGSIVLYRNILVN